MHDQGGDVGLEYREEEASGFVRKPDVDRRARRCGERVTGLSRRSDLHLTAVGEQFNAVDEAGVVGGQEEHGSCDLLGLTDAAGRNQTGELVLHAFRLCTAPEEIVRARGVSDAGG
jgi:hypothetical protein